MLIYQGGQLACAEDLAGLDMGEKDTPKRTFDWITFSQLVEALIQFLVGQLPAPALHEKLTAVEPEAKK